MPRTREQSGGYFCCFLTRRRRSANIAHCLFRQRLIFPHSRHKRRVTPPVICIPFATSTQARSMNILHRRSNSKDWRISSSCTHDFAVSLVGLALQSSSSPGYPLGPGKISGRRSREQDVRRPANHREWIFRCIDCVTRDSTQRSPASTATHVRIIDTSSSSTHRRTTPIESVGYFQCCFSMKNRDPITT